MRRTIDLEGVLPGADWQRLETWAALAGMTPIEYLRACVLRGHSALRDELTCDATVVIRPKVDGRERTSSG